MDQQGERAANRNRWEMLENPERLNGLTPSRLEAMLLPNSVGSGVKLPRRESQTSAQFLPLMPINSVVRPY